MDEEEKDVTITPLRHSGWTQWQIECAIFERLLDKMELDDSETIDETAGWIDALAKEQEHE